MNKQLQLTYDKGIANVPSDAICDDNMLEDSVGMVYDNGEHRPIQAPVEVFDEFGIAGRILFVHNLPTGQKNYIYINEDDQGTLWFFATNSDGSPILVPTEEPGQYTLLQKEIDHHGIYVTLDSTKINSVGKTLIVALSNNLQYYLWDPSANDYKGIGSVIPKPSMRFGLKNDVGRTVSTSSEETRLKYLAASLSGVDQEMHIVDADTFENSSKGAYAETKNKAAQSKAFCLPFLVRYALKMYDGEYMHISNPIIMYASVKDNHIARPGAFYLLPLTLHYKNLVSYKNWSDIVKNITIFVSAGIELYNLGLKTSINGHGEHDERYAGCVTINGYREEGGAHTVSHALLFDRRTNSEIVDDMFSTSTFYKLCDISALDVVSSWKAMGDHFGYTTLEFLTTQEQLKYDNYYSLAPLSAGYMFTYNNRLNITKVKRGFFAGYDYFEAVPEGSEHYIIRAKIASDNGDRVVEILTTENTRMGDYFFYPDPRATQVSIYIDGQGGEQLILNADLIEHPGLNGAYYYHGFYDPVDASTPPGNVSEKPPLTHADVDTSPETLNSYIITSEVNNPFLFKAEGYNVVGGGEVLGMTAITTALSQGQFGQFPVLVFTNEGIWAMSVSDTGLFSDINPVSRDVAYRINPCITQVDNAIFFISEKGLMVISGSQVDCVSMQLNGKSVNGTVSFHDFLCSPNTIMTYDYRDSLLWIINTGEAYGQTCYVYAMKNGTFSKFAPEHPIKFATNDFPDYIMQNNMYGIYSLIHRPDINQDSSRYAATMTTRPMKFGDGMSLKSIMQLKNVYQMEGDVSLRIYASNDMNNWRELHSLRNSPWKYYKFRFDFGNMKATDRFAGTQLVFQERRTNKLR